MGGGLTKEELKARENYTCRAYEEITTIQSGIASPQIASPRQAAVNQPQQLLSPQQPHLSPRPQQKITSPPRSAQVTPRSNTEITPRSNTEATPLRAATELIEIKKIILQKVNSHPDLLTTKMVFPPYIDVRVQNGRGAGVQYVQREVTTLKKSILSFHPETGMKLNLKKFEYLELSKKFPWLVKNAYFIRPSMKEFDFERVIGTGRTSTVILSKLVHQTDKFVAIKSIKKDYIFNNHELKHVLNEREALYTLNSSFCMKLFTEFEDAQFAYFVLEYVPGGELKAFLRDSGFFGPETTKFYMAELLSAIDHMHKCEIVHRNLCPENIAIDEDGHIKVIDFGSAINENYNLNHKLYTICCSAGYLSPEQLNSKYDGGYGKEVDFWQYGIIFYELMTGENPFVVKQTDSKYEILYRILKHKMKFPVYVDDLAKDLVVKILNPELDQRLKTVNEIRHHDFFCLSIKNWQYVENRQLIPPYIPKLRSPGDSSNFRATKGSAKHWNLGVLENKLQLF